ncbi:hypothetical protein P8452_39050 [Trifolium repens]|nr:hypothetical protein P8452_39050 [Trifolium repens]
MRLTFFTLGHLIEIHLWHFAAQETAGVKWKRAFCAFHWRKCQDLLGMKGSNLFDIVGSLELGVWVT